MKVIFELDHFLEFFFFFFAVPQGMWDPSSPPRAGTHVACSGSAECLPLDCQEVRLGCWIVFLRVFIPSHSVQYALC